MMRPVLLSEIEGSARNGFITYLRFICFGRLFELVGRHPRGGLVSNVYRSF